MCIISWCDFVRTYSSDDARGKIVTTASGSAAPSSWRESWIRPRSQIPGREGVEGQYTNMVGRMKLRQADRERGREREREIGENLDTAPLEESYTRVLYIRNLDKCQRCSFLQLPLRMPPNSRTPLLSPAGMNAERACRMKRTHTPPRWKT